MCRQVNAGRTCEDDYMVGLKDMSSGYRRSTTELFVFAVPPWLKRVTNRIYEESGLFPSAINHVLINEYLPDQGIMVGTNLDCVV